MQVMSSSLVPPPLAGISIPNTRLLASATSWVTTHLEPWATKHVFRCLYLGFAIADNDPAFRSRERELHAVASLLHDMSWNPTNNYSSPDKRFEVDAVNSARDFVRREMDRDVEVRAAWDERRLQLLWDAIALHTTPSIALHKEVEVVASALGIAADFFGPQGLKALDAKLAESHWQAIYGHYPREGFKQGVVDVCCGLCRTKPHTTWDNFVGEIGEELEVEGYKGKGTGFPIFCCMVFLHDVL